ncbi:hypothetical protein TNIN_205701 [Trichonephila inaurata madagascariensis]|uniref:Uncharacterized protein n=1 Tax=Trichonephila inaurata madagascariensis TaxID=2747483 RepID=A0A8X6XC22_9ARAC|nr:hypothetical protein TNIN_205701 [Trichonephila inaurata madagascariensis]
MARTKQTARKTAQNLPPPTDHDICNELMMIQTRLEFLRSQMTATEKFLIRCRLGTIKILPLHDEMREKLDEQKRQFDTDIGKKLRQAQGDERLDVFYRHLINN